MDTREWPLIAEDGELTSEWDYDLVGAYFYVVAAAVDVANNCTAWRSDQSSLFSLATALFFGRLSRVRMIGAVAIPLLFALIATPGKPEDIPFTLVDFPAMVGVTVSFLPGIYLSQEYWLAAGIWSGVVIVVGFVSSLVWRRNLARALRPTAWAALITAGTVSTLPILSIAPVACMAAMTMLERVARAPGNCY
ncbi:hypothetical protein B0H17DRAFT_1208787 [Mycena rosella]|uniref:Uncharacterized protein n=1 Tax=Mycena rosella TaxID=1033263 RepID=A0AAD7CZW5_MYCRO|nr:hypothetical protein B0H17DRAFT_1208787 [Mycena rosella]